MPGYVGSAGARPIGDPRKRKDPGDDLFSRKAALSVSSALESLTSVFGMGTGMASPLASPGSCCWIVIGVRPCVRLLERGRREKSRSTISLCCVGIRYPDSISPLTLGQKLKWSSPRPLVPLSYIRHRTSTCGLYNRWSTCGLTRFPGGEPHLQASFALRCFQRLSLPNIATQRCPWRDNWHTSGSSTPVLSY